MEWRVFGVRNVRELPRRADQVGKDRIDFGKPASERCEFCGRDHVGLCSVGTRL
jgi:hypothetical protein